MYFADKKVLESTFNKTSHVKFAMSCQWSKKKAASTSTNFNSFVRLLLLCSNHKTLTPESSEEKLFMCAKYINT